MTAENECKTTTPQKSNQNANEIIMAKPKLWEIKKISYERRENENEECKNKEKNQEMIDVDNESDMDEMVVYNLYINPTIKPDILKQFKESIDNS